jgi:spermidine synthase
MKVNRAHDGQSARTQPAFLGLRVAVLAVLLGLGVWCVLGQRPQISQVSEVASVVGADQGSTVELEEKSAYSKIRITKEKSVRTMWFVPESGEAIVESMVDMGKPHELLVPYTRYMFTSYFFRPKQEKVLIVGLGGGAMIHFLKHYDSHVKIDVVEIDPAVVKIAEKYFGIRSGGKVHIITQDALEYLKNSDAKYDVIYMDAFLKPSADTDKSGVPLRLKTIQFYKEIQKKLIADGLVVYNVHPHDKAPEDIQIIREAFPQTYLFRLPNFGGYVAVGSLALERLDIGEVRQAAEDLDRRFQRSFSWRDMAERLAPI